MAYHQNNNIILLTKEGLGIRSTARILKISITTLLKRIIAIAKSIHQPIISKGKIYEVDEMCTYIRHKKNFIWLVYALEKDSKSLVAFNVGKRTNKTLSRVLDSLKLSDAKKIFTDRLTTQPNTVVNSKNLSKNDVCFMLYEYNVDVEKIDSIINKIKNNPIAKYSSNDSCLIIVNRFETIDTHQNRKDVKVTDSTKINRDCYLGLYPVPNFVDYRDADSSNDLKLGKDFDIYVFEAESGNNFKEFDLLANFQMPADWKNGFSKGIAINREKKIVIYWSIIW